MSDIFTVPDLQGARLNQPWRAWVALGEVVLAAAAVIVGIRLWGVGVTTMVTPLAGNQPPLLSTIYYGNWMAYAIGLVIVAALLLLDAIREVLLATRTRRTKVPPLVTAGDPAAD